jgi:molecular chaperone DnaK
MEGNDQEIIKQKSEELMKASHKLAEQMYAKTGAAGPGAGPEAGAGAGPGAGHGHEEKAKKPEEEVVEAEFEEVK